MKIISSILVLGLFSCQQVHADQCGNQGPFCIELKEPVIAVHIPAYQIFGTMALMGLAGAILNEQNRPTGALIGIMASGIGMITMVPFDWKQPVTKEYIEHTPHEGEGL